jgi:hypothetical protein
MNKEGYNETVLYFRELFTRLTIFSFTELIQIAEGLSLAELPEQSQSSDQEVIDEVRDLFQRNMAGTEEEELDGVVEFMKKRPLSPTSERILEGKEIWPKLAYERAKHDRGIFRDPPDEKFLDEQEVGAISCQTNFKDPRKRLDPNPKRDDPKSKVITSCFCNILPSF